MKMFFRWNGQFDEMALLRKWPILKTDKFVEKSYWNKRQCLQNATSHWNYRFEEMAHSMKCPIQRNGSIGKTIQTHVSPPLHSEPIAGLIERYPFFPNPERCLLIFFCFGFLHSRTALLPRRPKQHLLMRLHQSPKQLPRQPAGGEDNKLQPPPSKKEESFYFCLAWTLPLPWSWIAMRCLVYLVPTTTQGPCGQMHETRLHGKASAHSYEKKRSRKKTNKLMLLELWRRSELAAYLGLFSGNLITNYRFWPRCDGFGGCLSVQKCTLYAQVTGTWKVVLMR